MRALLDAVLVDIGGTLVAEAPATTAVADLRARPLPGAVEDLAWLASWARVGAVTNTSVLTEADVRALLVPTGLDQHLEVVVTSVDAGAAKPDPAAMGLALARLGLTDPSRVLYVGDRDTDAQAAASAGMHFALVAPDAGDGSEAVGDAAAVRPAADEQVASEPVAGKPVAGEPTGGAVRAAVEVWLEATAGRRFAAAAARVGAVDPAVARAAAQHHDQLTKPPGSLGRVEVAGIRLAAIAGQVPPPVPAPAEVVVFAADHGVHAAGVSPWPQEVTAQMVANLCVGGAAINVIARHAGAEVSVVDVGVATPLPAAAEPARRRAVRAGSADLSAGPALTATEARAALDVGVEAADDAVARGARVLLTGDMGIANTTPSAALIAAITGRPAAQVTGRGAGADDDALARKTAVVEAAVARLRARAGGQPDPVVALAEIGGAEIAALAGYVVGAAAHRVPVVVDGVIALAATVVAVALVPDVADYVIAGHRSVEPGASAALAHLGLEPVLDLDLRLGEGTGAALALPVVQVAAKLMREMATFDTAGVSGQEAERAPRPDPSINEAGAGRGPGRSPA